jgi:membrane protein DedA with SNARE-associated domain
VDVLAVIGLAGIILAKEIGVPIPLPGDLLIVGAGVSVAGDLPAAIIVLGVLLAAGYVGSSIQFLAARGVLRRPLLAGLGKIGVTEEALESLAGEMRRSGTRGVALARMTPGIRIAATPAAALAAMPFLVFLPGLMLGNGVFVGAHFGIGYLLGAYATEFLENAGPFKLVAIVAITAVAAVAGWVVLRRRMAAARNETAFACWADCSCPACVALVGVAGAS